MVSPSLFIYTVGGPVRWHILLTKKLFKFEQNGCLVVVTNWRHANQGQGLPKKLTTGWAQD